MVPKKQIKIVGSNPKFLPVLIPGMLQESRDEFHDPHAMEAVIPMTFKFILIIIFGPQPKYLLKYQFALVTLLSFAATYKYEHD